jgi:hypothetical protein
MAITYVQGAAGGFSVTQTPGYVDPSGVASGDIVIVYFVTNSTHNSSGTPPTGWTKIAQINGAANDETMSAFWKRHPATSDTFTNLFDATETGRSVIVAYRGCIDSGDPLSVAAITAGIAAGTAWDTGSITPADNDCMLVAAFGCDPTSNPYTFTWDAGVTERVDSDTTPSGQTNTEAYIAIGDKILATPAATTLGGDVSVSDSAASIILALKPAATGVTVTATRASATAESTAPPKPRPTAPFSEVNLRM